MDVFQVFLIATGVAIACNIGLDEFLKDEFLKQFKLTFVEMNAMRREMKKSTACKTQVIN